MKFRSKKGQLPFVELDGTEIPDSTIIIRELSQKFHKDLDANLTNEQRIISHAMISMIENHLVWVVTSWRAKNTDATLKGYRVNLQNALGSRLPNGILALLFKISYSRKVLAQLFYLRLIMNINYRINFYRTYKLGQLIIINNLIIINYYSSAQRK